MQIKIIAIGLAIFAALAGIAAYGNSQYKAGYNAHTVESATATEKAVASAEARINIELSIVIEQKEKERNAALKLAQKLRTVKQRVVYRDIEIISDSQCKRLGADFTRVFNNIVGEPPGANNNSGQGSSEPPRSDTS